MSEAAQLALIQNLPAILAAVAAIIAAIVGIQAKAQQQQTHTLINSRMTELLASTDAAARAQGDIAGRESERTLQQSKD